MGYSHVNLIYFKLQETLELLRLLLHRNSSSLGENHPLELLENLYPIHPKPWKKTQRWNGK